MDVACIIVAMLDDRVLLVFPNNSKKVDATQLINNELNLQNANGNNVAFASGISSTVNPYLSTSNNIHV